MLLRLRPSHNEIILCNMESPYELHLIQFGTEADFESFLQDNERKRFLHLKKQSIQSSLVVKGKEL